MAFNPVPFCEDPVPPTPCSGVGVVGTDMSTIITDCIAAFDLLSFTVGYSAAATFTRIPCASGTEAIGTLVQLGPTSYEYTADNSEVGSEVCITWMVDEGPCSNELTVIFDLTGACSMMSFGNVVIP